VGAWGGGQHAVGDGYGRVSGCGPHKLYRWRGSARVVGSARSEDIDPTELLMNDPGSLMSMGFMGGPNGAADSWSTPLNLDPEVG
jgi:hypothetical protein